MQSLKKIHAWAQMKVPLWANDNRDIALESCQNFVFAQYLKNESKEFDKLCLYI